MYLQDDIITHDLNNIKLRSYKDGKIIFEQKIGEDLFKKTNQWNLLNRIINRKEDLYIEFIINPKTNKIIKLIIEPLSRHINHGSAKSRK